ncbi:pentapeptide repeat-containing protein [Agrobacterium radiobacter]|uniref:pentapeptide repeat-containing protein n=1 Tax=Agrobacterium radiobacter TaxID=362 RepID=UPI003F86BEB2
MNEAFETVIAQVLDAPTDRFTHLIEVAGLDPARDLRHADLQNVDFVECVLSGYDFRGARLTGAKFANARITGAIFDPEVYESGILASATDYSDVAVARSAGGSEAGTPGFRLERDRRETFFWQSELLKVVGCLKARKSVNIYGRPGAGKSVLLNEAVAFIRQNLKLPLITISSDSYDLSHALQRQLESKQVVGASQTKELTGKDNRRHHNPVVIVEDADRFSPEDLEKFVLICLEAEIRYVIVTTLPLWETTEIDTLESASKPIPISPHELTNDEIFQIADFFPGGSPRELGANIVRRDARGLTARQTIALSMAFYQKGGFDNAYCDAFLPEIDLLEMAFRTDERSRMDLYQVLDVLCRAKGGSLTARDIAGRANVPLDRVNRTVLSLRQKGIVKRVKRRGFAFVTIGLLRIVRDNFEKIYKQTS